MERVVTMSFGVRMGWGRVPRRGKNEVTLLGNASGN